MKNWTLAWILLVFLWKIRQRAVFGEITFGELTINKTPDQKLQLTDDVEIKVSVSRPPGDVTAYKDEALSVGVYAQNKQPPITYWMSIGDDNTICKFDLSACSAKGPGDENNNCWCTGKPNDTSYELIFKGKASYFRWEAPLQDISMIWIKDYKYKKPDLVQVSYKKSGLQYVESGRKQFPAICPKDMSPLICVHYKDGATKANCLPGAKLRLRKPDGRVVGSMNPTLYPGSNVKLQAPNGLWAGSAQYRYLPFLDLVKNGSTEPWIYTFQEPPKPRSCRRKGRYELCLKYEGPMDDGTRNEASTNMQPSTLTLVLITIAMLTRSGKTSFF